MISYIGGKYRMAKWINEYIPQNINSYSEIFGGAFWVYLKSNIDENENIKEINYNDFNRFMVNLFACAKNPEKFYKYFENIPSQNEVLFNQYKDEILKLEENNEINNINIPDYSLGFKYPYLLTQVFSGTGIKRNTKMMDLKGKYKSKFDSFRGRLLDKKFSNKLRKINNTYNMDFEDAVKKIDKEGAFLYFDPPYYDTETYYSFHDFGKKDHERLANTLKKMEGLFMLSYYEFNDLSKWFPKDKYVWIEKEFAKAASAKKGVSQNKGKEVLIMNYKLNEKNNFIKI